jgi:YHS domain-containing protein
MRLWRRKTSSEERPPKVTDPVCGMAFDREKAVATVIYGERTLYFCTQACREQFEEDPSRYLDR